MRTTKGWVGATDDSRPPSSVQVRVFEKTGGRCAECGRRLRPGHWAVDHVVPLADGGENVESNLQALCVSPCHTSKTSAEASTRAPLRRKKQRAVGAKRLRRTIPGRRFDGTPIPSKTVYR